MANKNTKDDNASDMEFFKSAMQDVKPLIRSKRRVHHVPPAPLPRRIKQPPLAASDPVDGTFVLSDYEKLPPVSSEDLISFRREGISEKTLRKLRRGQYNPGPVLDLHGYTTDEARLLLCQFLTTCQQQKKQCVCIIHGRGIGIPVLKNRLNHWLRDAPPVLAFCSINKGALYVLLRRTNA